METMGSLRRCEKKSGSVKAVVRSQASDAMVEGPLGTMEKLSSEGERIRRLYVGWEP
jgi:hypothetical protein